VAERITFHVVSVASVDFLQPPHDLVIDLVLNSGSPTVGRC
jgi:hypothetical protein